MSTKLYNGFRLAAGTDLFDFCQAMRTALRPVLERLDATLLARQAAERIDRAWFGQRVGDVDGDLPVMSTRPLWSVYRQFEIEQAKRSANDPSTDPHGFDATFCRDPETSNVFGLAFYTDDAYEQPFESLPGWRPFGYWNNTDRPESVTEREWDHRRDVWDRLLPMGAVPAEEMLTFRLRCQPTHGIFMLATSNPVNPLLLQGLPSDTYRAKVVLRTALLTTIGVTPDSLVARVMAAESVAAANYQQVLETGLTGIGEAELRQFEPDPAGCSERAAWLQHLAEGLAEVVLEKADR